MNNNIKQNITTRSSTIKEVVGVLERIPEKIMLVINPEYKLLGTVTDGDVRRGLLRGVSLENNITEIMNTSPVVADLGATEASKQALMQEKGHRHIPVVDSFGILKDLTSLDTFKNVSKKENLVFLMAGGLESGLGHLPRVLLNL